MEPIVDNLGIDTECIADYKISEIPPWTLNSAEFRFDLASDKKSVTNRSVARQWVRKYSKASARCVIIYEDKQRGNFILEPQFKWSMRKIPFYTVKCYRETYE